MYSVSYAEFTVPLVKAVQELSQENAVPKAEIKTLQKQVEDTRTQLEEIKTILNNKTSN